MRTGLNRCLIAVLIWAVMIEYSCQQERFLGLNPVAADFPSSCNSTTEYYNVLELQCAQCPTGSRPIDAFNCRCNQDRYFLRNNGGGSITCAPCPAGNFIQSLDGFSCVLCDAACQACIRAGGYRSDTNEKGEPLIDAVTNNRYTNCFNCNLGTSFSSSAGCLSCKPSIFAETTAVDAAVCDVDPAKVLAGFLIVDYVPSVTDPRFTRVNFGSPAEFYNSYLFEEFLLGTYLTCRTRTNRNVTSCQMLANLCVLNLYSFVGDELTGTNIDACKAYSEIYLREVDGLGTGQPTVQLPWIEYSAYAESQNYAIYIGEYNLLGINGKKLRLESLDSCSAGSFQFYAAEYNLNGNLKKFGEFDVSTLQLCNRFLASQGGYKVDPFSTTEFEQSCDISVEKLLEVPTVFYDVYLDYLRNQSDLFPIPVKVVNLRKQRKPINFVGNTDNHELQRRFFLVDTVSSKETKTSEMPEFVRYAKSITIEIRLNKNGQTGEIYPPLIIVDYDFISTRDLDKTVQVEFKVSYKMNINEQVRTMWIIFGVLSGLAFLWSVIRIWNWNRRSGKYAVDLVTLFKFIMYLIGSMANVFCIVLVGMSLYWLILYRGQYVAVTFIPAKDQERIFSILLIVGFSLKFLDVLYLIFVQTSYDIFFIDWERPKSQEQKEVIADGFVRRLPPIQKKNGKSEEEEYQMQSPISDLTSTVISKVSCWRTLFVANEWNELQVFRKINLTIQIVLVLFLLKFINLEALALRDCSDRIFRDANDYQAQYSGLLRIGIGSAIYLAVGLFQLMVYHAIYVRCVEDKIGQFVDFCSLSNISMFIMTHSQYGYYVHGRSPHGNAETNMQQMTQALIKEELDMTTRRGLEEGSDHQTFSLFLTNRLSRQYAKIMAPIHRPSRGRYNRAGDSLRNSELEKRLMAYTQLNKFLIGFINNILRDMKYIIIERNFIEGVLDVEFQDPLINGFFYQDDMSCFVQTIFYGKEITLFIFDLLVFLFVDYFAQNYILAGFVLYVVSKFFKIIRSDLGKRNIARKTLVDKRFLI